MSLASTINFIVSHPLNKDRKLHAMGRFFKWQLNTRLNPWPIIYPYTDKAKLIIHRSMYGATGNLYCGFHDFSEMLFLLHFLREKDLFVDIGANVGSYTILASSHVGARTISFEPVPSTFEHLINNIAINRIYDRVKAFNIAVGAANGTINFTRDGDTINHVATEKDADIIVVKIKTLDDVLNDFSTPALLKIDVEGFETEVIKGGNKTLNLYDLKAIIIELNGLGARYGYDDRKIHKSLLELGFRPNLYDPFTRNLSPIDTFGNANTIYVRDMLFVMERLKASEKVRIYNKQI